MYRSYYYRVVNKLRTEVEVFEVQTERTEAKLAAALKAANARIFELSTLVISLIETLEAAGTLDVAVLEARMENLRGSEPWSADHPEPTTPDRPYTCAACFAAMPMAEGTMTTGGMVCGSCRNGA